MKYKKICFDIDGDGTPDPDTSSQFLTERRLEVWYPNPAVAVPGPGGS